MGNSSRVYPPINYRSEHRFGGTTLYTPFLASLTFGHQQFCFHRPDYAQYGFCQRLLPSALGALVLGCQEKDDKRAGRTLSSISNMMLTDFFYEVMYIYCNDYEIWIIWNYVNERFSLRQGKFNPPQKWATLKHVSNCRIPSVLVVTSSILYNNQWASYQIRQIAGAHAPGMPGMFSPPSDTSDPDMHHGTCVTHVPWCMPESLTSVFLWSRRRGKTFPAFPAHAQPTILRIWQEANGSFVVCMLLLVVMSMS